SLSAAFTERIERTGDARLFDPLSRFSTIGGCERACLTPRSMSCPQIACDAISSWLAALGGRRLPESVGPADQPSPCARGIGPMRITTTLCRAAAIPGMAGWDIRRELTVFG